MSRRFKFITLLAVAGIALTACAGNSEVEAEAPTSGNSGDSSEVDYSEALAIVEAATVRPDTIVVDEPLSEAPPTGKNIYWIECALPACINLGDSLEEATDLLGWNLIRVDAGTSPEDTKDAWVQAVQGTPAPDAVMASGTAREVYEDELAILEARGVPAVNLSTNDEVGGALIASIGTGEGRNVKVGELQAAATIVAGEGSPNAVYVYSSAFPSNPPQVAGFMAEYERLCPDCEVTSFDAPIQSIGTTLPADLTAFLQANPQIDHVVFSYGDMAIGFPAAIAEIGMQDRINIIVDTPGVIGSSLMDSGEAIIYATAYPGADFIWQGVDVILRYMIGDDYTASAEAEPLQWIITQDTVPSTTEDYPVVADQQEQYKALWNLG